MSTERDPGPYIRSPEAEEQVCVGDGRDEGESVCGLEQTAQRYHHTEVVPVLSRQLTLTRSGGASRKSVQQGVLFGDHIRLGKIREADGWRQVSSPAMSGSMKKMAPEVRDKAFLCSLGSHIPIEPTHPLVTFCLVPCLLSDLAQKANCPCPPTLLMGIAQ